MSSTQIRLTRHTISIALLVSLTLYEFTQATPLVLTTQGFLRGYTTPKAQVFRGIRYAKPPVGDLRWQAPQSPSSWGHDILNANQSGPGCPQIHCDEMTPTIACPKNTAEDCLFLDVYTPIGAKNGSDLPVMLFIHGGNFFFMSGSSPLFDGEIFSSRGNVVLVNINYRLGALGFLVTGRGDGAATGNYGLFDQRLAFQWVQDNIRGFGGDPKKVTLFGQSAGSQSILHHMTSPKSAPYFRAALLESDPVGLPYRTFGEASYLGSLFAKQLKCDVSDMKCLRSKSTAEVTQAGWSSRGEISTTKLLEMFEPYGPWVDGTEVKGQPIDVIEKGGLVDPNKPVVMGTLTEETVLYIYSAFKKPVSLVEYLAIVELFKPLKSIQILEKYPPSLKTSDQREILVNLSRDYVFSCSSRHVIRDIANKTSTNTWLYVWNHAMSFPGWGHVKYCEGRVCHGTELVFVFDTAWKGNYTMTPAEQAMTFDVIDFWTNFAWSGDPNKRNDKTTPSPGRITWPPYRTSNNWSTMLFETPARKVINEYKNEFCNFWDSIGFA